MSQQVKRLTDQFRPEHYVLELKIDRQAMTFTGTVKIIGQKVGRPSQRLTFHQKDLTITAATIVKIDKTTRTHIELFRLNRHKTYDEVRLHTKDTLYPGLYEVALQFNGKITRPMQGIYPCYFKHNGQDKMLIATQFESHHAREAFPCIDEPEAKATFDLILTTPVGGTVLANTPIKNQTITGSSIQTSFETTPRMSTYLLAFVYGDLHSVTATTKNGITVSSWATVAQPKEHLKYANGEAVKLLDFFEDYFNVPFPLKKLDQVALPDFDSLAMENWGLITFREVGLLTDSKNRSISAERLITMVVAHELSHQWFGNLVTMKWWDDLWLNESFASIMESLAPDYLHPDWQEWENFTSSRVLGAANRDVYKDVQPVGVRVKYPDEILSLFDPMIVYAKGARILKMLFDFIGEEAFKAGLSYYFKKHAYQNTSRQDLWQALSKTSNIDIHKLMTPWIEQSGAPELIVETTADKLQLTQQRFLLDGEDQQTRWPIPLLADQKIEPNILTERSAKVSSADEPIFNPTGSGHYIVRYNHPAMYDKVTDKIVNRRLPSEGRIITLNDRLLQIQKDRRGLTSMLELISKCGREDRDAVWSVFLRAIGFAQLLTDDDDTSEDLLNVYKRTLAEYWYAKLGWDDKPKDEPNTKLLRITALALTLAGEQKQAVKLALNKMAKAKTVEALPAEQRALIAGIAVRFGESHYIKDFMHEYQTTANPDVQASITSALCSTKDEKVAKQIVKWGMYNDDIIRPQDIDAWYAYLMRNRYTRRIAWNWLKDRWSHLLALHGDGKKMEYFIWYASRPISTPQWQKRYKQFFEPMIKDVSMKRNILISFSEIQARIDWRKQDKLKIAAWLKDNVKAPAENSSL